MLLWQAQEKPSCHGENSMANAQVGQRKRSRRMLKKDVQQGRRRSKNRRRSSFSPAHPKLPRQLVLQVGYVEDSCEMRTKRGTRRVLARQGWAGEKSGFLASCPLCQHQAPRRQLTKDWLKAVAEGRLNDLDGVEGISSAGRLVCFPDGDAAGELEEGTGSALRASSVEGVSPPILASRLFPSLAYSLSGYFSASIVRCVLAQSSAPRSW